MIKNTLEKISGFILYILGGGVILIILSAPVFGSLAIVGSGGCLIFAEDFTDKRIIRIHKILKEYRNTSILVTIILTGLQLVWAKYLLSIGVFK